MRATLELCNARGKFLFEARPDIFPPRLSYTELALWGMYYKEKHDREKHR